jgi:hypothetical protein
MRGSCSLQVTDCMPSPKSFSKRGRWNGIEIIKTSFMSASINPKESSKSLT